MSIWNDREMLIKMAYKVALQSQLDMNKKFQLKTLKILKSSLKSGLEIAKAWKENEGVECPVQVNNIKKGLREVNRLLKGLKCQSKS